MEAAMGTDVGASEKERDYLTMMYEEHTEHARQHEMLRAAVAGFLIALIAGLLAIAVLDGQGAARNVTVGITISAVSVLGWLLNAKHYELYELHRDIARRFRAALEVEIKQSLHDIQTTVREKHGAKHPLLSKLRLNILWNIVYMIAFALGMIITFIGVRN